MKKLSLLLFAFLLSFIFILSGCSNNGNNKIRINEVTHSVFYAPLYVAINNSYFKDEGLEIELTNGGGADKSMAAILSGEADVGLLGPEATIYIVEQGASDHPVVFGQLTKRDGSFLMSKNPEPNFKWTDLIGKEVIGGRRGGVPAMTLQYVMEQAGLNPGDEIGGEIDTKLNLDVQFNLVAAAFEASNDAYCTMFEPTASDYEKAGKGYIVASVGQASGEVPYTAFTAKKSYLKDNEEKMKKFLRAVMKGYYFIVNNTLDDVASALLPSFAGTSLEQLKTAIQSYKDIDAWNNTPVMQADAFDRLQNIMINAGELENKVDFSKAVDNSIAFKIMQEFNS